MSGIFHDSSLAGDNVTVWIEAPTVILLNGPNRSVSEKFVFQLESQSEYHQKYLPDLRICTRR